MLKIGRLTVCGITKDKKYLVFSYKNEYYKVKADDGTDVIRHKCLFR